MHCEQMSNKHFAQCDTVAVSGLTSLSAFAQMPQVAVARSLPFFSAMAWPFEHMPTKASLRSCADSAPMRKLLVTPAYIAGSRASRLAAWLLYAQARQGRVSRRLLPACYAPPSAEDHLSPL